MNPRLVSARNAALALLLAACSSNTPTSTGTGSGGGPFADQLITVADYAFTPDSVTISVGKTVEWSNSGPSSHTVTSNASTWSSTTLAAPSGTDPYGSPSGGGTFTFTFNTPGTYHYHCSIHAGMTGVVVVTP